MEEPVRKRPGRRRRQISRTDPYVRTERREHKSQLKPEQQRALEDYYREIKKSPNWNECQELGMDTGVHPTRIKNWFARKRDLDPTVPKRRRSPNEPILGSIGDPQVPGNVYEPRPRLNFADDSSGSGDETERSSSSSSLQFGMFGGDRRVLQVPVDDMSYNRYPVAHPDEELSESEEEKESGEEESEEDSEDEEDAEETETSVSHESPGDFIRGSSGTPRTPLPVTRNPTNSVTVEQVEQKARNEQVPLARAPRCISSYLFPTPPVPVVSDDYSYDESKPRPTQPKLMPQSKMLYIPSGGTEDYRQWNHEQTVEWIDQFLKCDRAAGSIRNCELDGTDLYKSFLDPLLSPKFRRIHSMPYSSFIKIAEHLARVHNYKNGYI